MTLAMGVVGGAVMLAMMLGMMLGMHGGHQKKEGGGGAQRPAVSTGTAPGTAPEGQQH